MHRGLSIGADVLYEGKPHSVIRILNATKAAVCNRSTGEVFEADTRDLQAAEATSARIAIDAVLANKWDIAAWRYKCIEPLLDLAFRTRSAVRRRAEEVRVDTATLYHWLRAFESTKHVSALLPKKRVGRPGLLPEQEAVISQVLESMGYTKAIPSIAQIASEVERVCVERGVLPVPHYNTIRSRVHARQFFPKQRKLKGYREEMKLEPIKGATPGGDSPRAMVEIDHCELDIVLVGRGADRLPVGRPWLTWGIDLFSRMITGYHLSFDHPGSASVAMCILSSVMPKHDFIKKHGLKLDWPYWGLMDAIKVDNAKEFTSETLVRACQEHGIQVERRPARHPHFAGSVERSFGSLQAQIKLLPGATSSNPQARGNVNPVSTASMTLSEFDHWLAKWIVDVYHNTPHSGINTTPLKKYEEGIFDDSKGLPRGLPAPIQDPEKLRLDFMPTWKRTIQRYGVQIDGVDYYDDVLGPYVKQTVPGTRRNRIFTFKRDPSDVSRIYFLDPNLQTYFTIPARDRTMDAWPASEWKRYRRWLRKTGQSAKIPAVSTISRAEMKQIVSGAQAATRKSRRGRKPPIIFSPRMFENAPQTVVPKHPSSAKQFDAEHVEPFDELE